MKVNIVLFRPYTPAEFEINNPNISLNIFNENQEQIYTSINNTPYQVNITELKNDRYAAMKPPKNKYTQLNKMLKSFSHTELKEYISNLLINFHCLHLLHLHSIIQSSSHGITFHLPPIYFNIWFHIISNIIYFYHVIITFFKWTYTIFITHIDITKFIYNQVSQFWIIFFNCFFFC